MSHLVPCHTTVDAEQTASLYLQNVWKLQVLPDYITSNRGTQITFEFWLALCKQFMIQARMATAYHSETDGQTKRLNAVMEQYLRHYYSYQQADWADWLRMAEFAANNHVSANTKATPIFANYGYNP